jgi:hypothetical protein
MPLARIITEVADDCLELTMQLRARGFQVETVPPGMIPSTPADLEVRLEECAPEDVVSHMAQTAAGGDDLWVFVAPGALDSNALPIRSGPISIESATPRISLRKSDAGLLDIPHVAERIATVRPPAMSAQELKPSNLGKAEVPAVLGSLAIDAQEEDLILAELREFPVLSAVNRPVAGMPAATAADVSAVPAEIRLIEKAGVLTRLAARVAEARVAEAKVAEVTVSGEAAKKVEEKRACEKVEIKEAVAHEGVKENVVTTKWLQAPEKIASPPNVIIPIAPEPVRATIVVPVTKAVQKAKAPRAWNLQKLKVGCSVAALAISAWFLIGTARLGEKRAAVQPKATQQASQPAPSSTSVKAAQPQVKHSPDARVATAVPKATAIPKPTAVSNAPSTAVSPSKARPTHLSDDGMIAKDTVVFYDRKQPRPRANVTRPEPGAKGYSDRE